MSALLVQNGHSGMLFEGPQRVGSRDQYLSQPISAVDQKAAIKQVQNATPFISAYGQQPSSNKPPNCYIR
jgi:hypothetical protein